MPCVGLHHASVTNGFNLADDLIEPFRPFVDAAVFQYVGAEKPSEANLSISDRREMAGLLLREALLNGEAMTLLTATEQVASSLVRAMEAGNPRELILPEFVISPCNTRAA